MAFQPAPGVLRVVVNQSMSGKQIANVLHMQRGLATEIADVEFMAEAAFDAWRDTFLLTQSTSLTLDSVQCYDLATETGVTYTTSRAAVAGSVGSAAFPNSVAGCVTWRTSLRGRSGRGRSYIGGVTDAFVTGDEFTPTALAAYQVAGNQFINLMNATLNVFAVLSRNTGKVVRPNGLAYAIVSADVTDARVDSQRRRTGR